MFFLIALALSSSLFLIFRSFERFKINTFQAVVINYWTCVLTALVYLKDLSMLQHIAWEHLWVRVPFLLGVLFISTFYLMGYVAQRVGVASASVASKISLVIPVLFNLCFFEHRLAFSWLNYVGLLLVFVAIVLTSHRRTDKSENVSFSRRSILWLSAIFVMSGCIDTSLNWVSSVSAKDVVSQALFSMLIFMVAGSVGSVFVLVKFFMKKTQLKLLNVVAGVVLGVANYFSLIFMIRSLQEEFSGNGAYFFPIFNIGIILFSTLLAVIFFKEKLNNLNRLGIVVAILAILAMSYEDIFK